MKKPNKNENPLEAGLLRALSAIDNQVAREMQRSPEELEKHGVQKWEPYNKRVELITSLLLNSLGDNSIKLDSILVLSKALSKTLSYAVSDLGPSGLGKVRTSYCLDAADEIARDLREIEGRLRDRSLN